MLQGQAVPSPGPLSVLGSVNTSAAPLELGLELADTELYTAEGESGDSESSLD